MSSESNRPPPRNDHRPTHISVWPGIVVGASLGAVVGSASLLIRPDAGAAPHSSASAAATNAPLSTSGTNTSSEPNAPLDGETSSAASATGAPGEESEAAYLARATAQVQTAPAEALALAEGHAARFPTGKLGQEREMVAISALSALGRKAEARARAKLLLTLFPESELRAKVEELFPDLAPQKP